MSVQYGRCNFDGKPVNPKDLDEVRPVLAPFGPDGEGYICRDNFVILYRAFHTTKESRREKQPYHSHSGAIITWDGRLDNRKELIERLASGLSVTSTDLEIVAVGYELWGLDVLQALTGDWALSIWNPEDQSLILAKDCVGTRHLYYAVEKEQVTWCTVLDPLVLFAPHTFNLEEEYVAGWLSFFPATHLTPYVGIHGVPPSSFVRLTRRTREITKYWDFDPRKRIRYSTDGEYEEHFRAAFLESVRRRLRSDSPILAELSGGMDSSSIVCVADQIVRNWPEKDSIIDTVSYYDNSEPNWNELPYVRAVEEKRGKTGYYIDVGAKSDVAMCAQHGDQFAACPAAQISKTVAAEQFANFVEQHGYKVLLSGIGGDEVSGGVPSPLPELADLIVTLQMRALARPLKLWALNNRKPWLHLLWETIRAFIFPTTPWSQADLHLLSWLRPSFVERYRVALAGYRQRLIRFGPLPSFQLNVQTLEALKRQFASDALPLTPHYEKRFPFLDRDLLEFLFALPAEQLVRPGQRRSLMRRALTGIVPYEVLNRRRKAYSVRSPLTEAVSGWTEINKANSRMISEAFGIVDSNAFANAILRAGVSSAPPVVHMERTISLELWLAKVLRRHVVLPRQSVELHAGWNLGQAMSSLGRGEIHEERR